MIKKYFRPTIQTNFSSIALLVLRLIVGIALMIHGWGKIQTPFSWLPINASIQIFPVFQFLAATSEFVGGLAWILGFLTPLASFGIAITMVIAASVHINIFKDPFVNLSGGTSYEQALSYLGISLILMSIGPGKFSLDKLFFNKN